MFYAKANRLGFFIVEAYNEEQFSQNLIYFKELPKKGVRMKKNKILGVLLLVLAAGTVVGMVIQKDAYWNIYNYFTIIISVMGGFALLKQK